MLIQAGVGAVLPHLGERIAAGDPAAAATAQQIIEAWEHAPLGWRYRRLVKAPDRAEMLRLLTEPGDRALLERFVIEVATHDYDGSENETLAGAILLLGRKDAGRLITALDEACARTGW